MMVTKKPAVQTPLSMVDIVMRADVATIRAALEAREKVDALLAERAAAYERIAALEKQIDDVVGAADTFVFPPPPVPVASYASAPAPKAPAPAPTHAPAAPAPSAPATPASTESETAPAAAPAGRRGPSGANKHE